MGSRGVAGSAQSLRGTETIGQKLRRANMLERNLEDVKRRRGFSRTFCWLSLTGTQKEARSAVLGLAGSAWNCSSTVDGLERGCSQMKSGEQPGGRQSRAPLNGREGTWGRGESGGNEPC